jgi:HEAT repeat protein
MNLEKMIKKKDFKGLLKAIYSKDLKKSLKGADALAKIPEVAAVPIWAKALERKIHVLSEIAVKSLGMIEDPTATQVLIGLFEDSPWKIQIQAAKVLEKSNYPQVTSTLIEIVEKNFERIIDLQNTLDKDQDWKSHYHQQIVSRRMEFEEILKVQIDLLGSLKNPSSFSILFKIFENSNHSIINRKAKNALVILNDPSVIPKLIEIITNEGNSTIGALSILEQMGMIKDPTIVSLLTSLIKKSDYLYSEIIAENLEKIGWEPSNLQERIFLLYAKRDYKSLDEINDPVALPFLIELCKKPKILKIFRNLRQNPPVTSHTEKFSGGLWDESLLKIFPKFKHPDVVSLLINTLEECNLVRKLINENGGKKDFMSEGSWNIWDTFNIQEHIADMLSNMGTSIITEDSLDRLQKYSIDYSNFHAQKKILKIINKINPSNATEIENVIENKKAQKLKIHMQNRENIQQKFQNVSKNSLSILIKTEINKWCTSHYTSYEIDSLEKTKLREYGEYLDIIGGIDAMRAMYYNIQPSLSHDASLALVALWNGIGDWQD